MMDDNTALVLLVLVALVFGAFLVWVGSDPRRR